MAQTKERKREAARESKRERAGSASTFVQTNTPHAASLEEADVH